MPGHDDIANIGFIVGEKCVAVIDTGGSLAIGRELRAAIAEHTPLPVCFVINTHVHVDHVLGNGAFVGAGVSFVGHVRLREAIARNKDFFIREYAGDFDPPPHARQVIGPDRLVGGKLTLDLGARELVLRAWPTAHTDCDLTIYDAGSGTLWTGDLLFRGRLPALDGSIKGWLSVLDELQGMKVKLAVPGHGRPTRRLGTAIEPNGAICRHWLTACEPRSPGANRWMMRSHGSAWRRNRVGCCGTRFIRAMCCAPMRNWSGSEPRNAPPPVPAAVGGRGGGRNSARCACGRRPQSATAPRW